MQGAAAGFLIEPAAVAEAHRVGVGSTPSFSLGDKSAAPGQTPFDAKFRIVRIGNGMFAATGPLYRGARMELPLALLEATGPRVQ